MLFSKFNVFDATDDFNCCYCQECQTVVLKSDQESIVKLPKSVCLFPELWKLEMVTCFYNTSDVTGMQGP